MLIVYIYVCLIYLSFNWWIKLCARVNGYTRQFITVLNFLWRSRSPSQLVPESGACYNPQVCSSRFFPAVVFTEVPVLHSHTTLQRPTCPALCRYMLRWLTKAPKTTSARGSIGQLCVFIVSHVWQWRILYSPCASSCWQILQVSSKTDDFYVVQGLCFVPDKKSISQNR